MTRSWLHVASLLLLLLSLAPAYAAEPEVVSVTKIWDQGKHNAFTDLIRWRGKWYCTFREAEGHVGGDGKLRVLESADGKKLGVGRPASTEEGIDLRDPKLSITPDDRLMIVAGGSVYEGKTLMGRQPRVAFSKDGREWTPPQRVLTEGEWLWRVTWHGGKAYGVSYNAAARTTPAAQEAAKTGKAAARPGRVEAQARRQQRRREVRPRHAPRRARPSQRNDAAVPARRRDGGPGPPRRRQHVRLDRPQQGRPTRNGPGRRRSTASAGRTSSACPTAACGPPAAAIPAARRRCWPA